MKYVPPWRDPYCIGIAGCSGSGKTSISRELVQRLNVPWTVLLSLDNFYRPLNNEERALAYKSEFDFDQPECVDFDLLLDTLSKLKRGEKVDVPIYSFKLHNRTSQSHTVYGANIIIIEGIYALYDPRVLDILDLKVFVHEDYDVCMARRLHRDILHRGRSLELTIKQWHQYVKPNYLAKILPTAKSANILIPKGIENKVAISMLFEFVRKQLRNKSLAHLQELQALGKDSSHKKSSVTQLEPSNQVRALQTMIANRNCDRETFVFAIDRLSRRLMTLALNQLWFEGIGSDSPSDEKVNRVCIATMVRGGEVFETAVRQMVPDIFIGRLLILSDIRTGEPKLHLSKLPTWLSSGSSRVILTESQILSGAAAVMAIAVLVDHGVKQENIVFCSHVASEIGSCRIQAAFPNVKLIFGRINPAMLSLDVDSRYYGSY